MRLFINYAHGDKHEVDQIIELLREGGHEPWSEKLLPGQEWESIISEAIQSTDAVIYALSPHSIVTEWCQWELAQAVKLGKSVIPLIVNTPVNTPQAISSFRAVDISAGINPIAVARLLGSLAHLDEYRVAADAIPAAPEHPRGIPAQAMGTMVPPGMRSGSSQATEE